MRYWGRVFYMFQVKYFSNLMFFFFPLQLDVEWEMVACGQTKDQLELTKMAHRYLKDNALKPRSLNF